MRVFLFLDKVTLNTIIIGFTTIPYYLDMALEEAMLQQIESYFENIRGEEILEHIYVPGERIDLKTVSGEHSVIVVNTDELKYKRVYMD